MHIFLFSTLNKTCQYNIHNEIKDSLKIIQLTILYDKNFKQWKLLYNKNFYTMKTASNKRISNINILIQ